MTGADAPRSWLQAPYPARPWSFEDTDRNFAASTTATVAVPLDTALPVVPDGFLAELTSVRAICWPRAMILHPIASPINVRATVQVRKNGRPVPGCTFQAARMLFDWTFTGEAVGSAVCCQIPQLHHLQAPVHLDEGDALSVLLTVPAAAVGAQLRVCTALSGWLYPAPLSPRPGAPGTISP